MASEVGICNLALAHLGDSATVASIDPPEGSAQAEHCAHFYPIARDSLIEMHAWKFATRRIALAQLAVASWGWDYAYGEPSGAVRILSVLGESSSLGTDTAPFETMGGPNGEALILTDLESAGAIYTVAVSDTSKFSSLFITALSWHLASMLAGPILKGDVGAAESKRCAQMMQAFLQQARVSDANQCHITTANDYTPAWIGVR